MNSDLDKQTGAKWSPSKQDFPSLLDRAKEDKVKRKTPPPRSQGALTSHKPIKERIVRYSGLRSEPALQLYGNTYQVLGEPLTDVELNIARRYAARGLKEGWSAADIASAINQAFSQPRRDSPKPRSPAVNAPSPSREGLAIKFKLPPDYIAHLKEMNRGPRKNYNDMLKDHKQDVAPNMDESQWQMFLASGLGPKEWAMLANYHDKYRAIVRKHKTSEHGVDDKGQDGLAMLAGVSQYLGTRFFPDYLACRVFEIRDELRKEGYDLPTWGQSLSRYYQHVKVIGNEDAAKELLGYMKRVLGSSLGAYPDKWGKDRLDSRKKAEGVSFKRLVKIIDADVADWDKAVNIKCEDRADNFSVLSAGAQPVPELDSDDDANVRQGAGSAFTIESHSQDGEGELREKILRVSQEEILAVSDCTIFKRPVSPASVTSQGVSMPSVSLLGDGQLSSGVSSDSDVLLEVSDDETNALRSRSSKGRKNKHGKSQTSTKRAKKEKELIQVSLNKSEQEKAAEADAQRDLIKAAKDTLAAAGLDRESAQVQPLHSHLKGQTFSVDELGTVEVVEAGDFSQRKLVFFNGTVGKRFKTPCGIIVKLYSADEEQAVIKVFISDIILQNARAKVWPSLTEAAKLSTLRCGSELQYPIIDEEGFTINPMHIIKALDIMFGKQSNDLVDTLPFEMVDSKYQGTVPTNPGFKLQFKDTKSMDKIRAHVVAVESHPEAHLFPINADNIQKMAIKRLTSKFNPSNWKVTEDDPLWKALAGHGNMDISDGMFYSYAVDTASRKGLSMAESAQWADRGAYFDEHHEALIPALREGLDRLNCFIKDELYPKDSTTLRLIVSPPLDVKIIFGAVFRQVEEMLYGPDQPISRHHFKKQSEAEVATTLNGLGLQPGQVFFETDYSAFESSQNRESLNVEYNLYKTYYATNSLGWQIIDAVQRANVRDHTVLHNKAFNVTVGPMRWSGMPNTACGNLIMNIMNLVSNCGLTLDDTFFCEGDDTIGVMRADQVARFAENSAYPLELLTSDDFSQLSFCGHHYVNGKRVPMIPSFAVAKLLTYFTRDERPLSLQSEYELMYLKSLSYQLLYPDWDGLHSILEILEEHYKNRVRPIITQKAFRNWRKANYWWLENRLNHCVDYDHLPQPKGRLFVHLHDSAISASEYFAMNRSQLESRLFPSTDDRGPGDPLTSGLRLISEYALKLGVPLAGVIAAAGYPKAGATLLALSGACKALVDYAMDEHGRDNFVLPLLKRAGDFNTFVKKVLDTIVNMLNKLSSKAKQSETLWELLELVGKVVPQGEQEQEYFERL